MARKDYWIVDHNSLRPLDVKGRSREEGAPLQIWDMFVNHNQAFRLEPAEEKSGHHRLVNRNSGKCLEVHGGSKHAGASVVQGTVKAGSLHQVFRLEKLREGGNRIVAAHSGLCLDVSRRHRKNGTKVIQWRPNRGDNQRFTLVSFRAPTTTEWDRVTRNLTRLVELCDKVQQYGIPYQNEAAEYFRAHLGDPGQVEAATALGLGFTAMEMAEVPGAGVAGMVFNEIFDALKDHEQTAKRLANIWERYNGGFLQCRTQLTRTHDLVAPPDGQREAGLWHRKVPLDDGKRMLPTLAALRVPSPASTAFTKLIETASRGIEYETWRLLTPRIWARVKSSSSVYWEKDETSWKALQKRRVEFCKVHPAYWLTFEKVEDGWEQWEHYIGHGGTATLITTAEEAPDGFCKKLFQDEGNGIPVRKTSIATRQDVFTNWPLAQETLYT